MNIIKNFSRMKNELAKFACEQYKNDKNPLPEIRKRLNCRVGYSCSDTRAFKSKERFDIDVFHVREYIDKTTDEFRVYVALFDNTKDDICPIDVSKEFSYIWRRM